MKIVILISVFLNTAAFGQSSILYNLNNNRLTSNAINKIGKTDLNNNDYEGSPFLNKDFQPSTISGEGGVHLLRYNIYSDEIVLKRDNDYFLLPKKELKSVVIGSTVIRMINDTYYVQLSKEINSTALLKKEQVKYTPGRISDNSYSSNTTAKFSVSKVDYYLFKTDTQQLSIFSHDNLLKLFPDKKDLINDVFKKNKLKKSEDYLNAYNMIFGK